MHFLQIFIIAKIFHTRKLHYNTSMKVYKSTLQKWQPCLNIVVTQSKNAPPVKITTFKVLKSNVYTCLIYIHQAVTFNIMLCGLVWFGFLRFYVDLAVFQPYLYLEAGDNQSLKIQVARPGIEPRSSCSASQELSHSATAAPMLCCAL